MVKEYDLIVVGSGAGLNVAAAAADSRDWRIAVVEDGPLGGTCLNRGCIPSKIIIHAADVAEEIKGASRYGLRAAITAVDFSRVTGRATEYVDHDSAEMEKGLRGHPRIDLYKIRAEFLEAKTLQVGEDRITSDKILLAAGARPAIPPIEGLDRVKYITSTEALRLTKQPKSLVILGGGYIAAELGHFYGALGTEVTIIQRNDLLLPREDEHLAKAFTRIFSKKYHVLLGQTAKKVSERMGHIVVEIEDKNGKASTVEGEALLLAVGITPNTDRLKVGQAGIKTNENGYIIANEYLETNVPGIWALGDIVGKAPFRHTANYEAELVTANLRGHQKHAADYSVIPHVIFSSPQIAGVGLTEDQAKEKHIPHTTKVFRYDRTAMGKALEEEEGFVKWILDEAEETILGCHILGPQASILIHEVAVVMASCDGKTSAIRNAIHAHPALSEVVGWSV